MCVCVCVCVYGITQKFGEFDHKKKVSYHNS